MLKRIITGLILIAAMVGFFFLRLIDIKLFAVLILAIDVIGTFEITRAISKHLNSAEIILILIFSMAVIPVYVFFKGFAALAVFALAVAVNFSLLVFNYKNTTVESASYTLFALIYPSMFLLPIVMANRFEVGSLFALLLIFVISPCTDMFAYFVGTLIKGPKLCPNISPKKTISGAIGGLIGGIAGALAVYFIVKPTLYVKLPVLFISALGLVCSVACIIGDLFESMIKRNTGIKDMGKLLPGHGGVLDRVDGIIFAAPIIYLALLIIQ